VSRRINHGRSAAGGWKILLTAGVLAAVLAGCGAAPDLKNDAARQLQAKLLTVSQSAAGNDPAGALRTLDELVSQLDASAANGDVSFKRHQTIMSAITAVRADLTAAQAAAAASAAAAAETSAPAVVVPAPAPVPSDSGKSEKGKGSGKGKGDG
jgi:hypothetical protein